MKKPQQLNIGQLENELNHLPMRELRQRFAASYGYTTQTRHRQHIIHRLLWSAQRDALGGISESVRKVASLLNCTLDDLSDMFRGYSLDVPFDL